MEKEKNLVSVFEASKILGISRMQVIRRIHAGRLPALKVGRSFVINKNDLGGIFKVLSEDDKKEIEKAVSRAVKEYGDVLVKLGAE